MSGKIDMKYGKYIVLIGVLCVGPAHAMKSRESMAGVENKAHRRSHSAMDSTPISRGSVSNSSMSGMLSNGLTSASFSPNGSSDTGIDLDYVALDVDKQGSKIESRDLLSTLDQKMQEDINAVVALRLMTDQLPGEVVGNTITVAHERDASQVDALAYELLKAHIMAEELAARLTVSETALHKDKAIVAEAKKSYKIAVTMTICAGVGALTSFVTTVGMLFR